MEHIEIKNSLDSKLQSFSICSIRNLNILEVIGFSKIAKCSTLNKCRDPQMATIVGSVLHILNSLDSNEIEFPTEKLAKEGKSYPDTLKVIYDSIFSSAQNSEQETDAIVATLCDWATTSYRGGIHRGVFVAKLLAYRQDQG